MIPVRQTIIAPGADYIVARENLIFCLCPVCLNEINWRHKDASYELNGSCCCHVYRARPANNAMRFYNIVVKEADMTNVYWLHRPGPGDSGAVPPPKRKG